MADPNQYLKNIRLGNAPIATPITTDGAQFGVPYEQRGNANRGALSASWAGWFTQASQRLNDLPGIVDTHANRVSGSAYLPDRYLGMFYYETDRGVLYMSRLVSNAPAWVWIAGECACLQAALPADLGANDAGFLAQVTDYGHRLKWSGAAWGWAAGDAGSGYMALFEVNPGTGWHLYDGSTVNYLQAAGTLGSITLPNISGATPSISYLKAGAVNSGPNAASGATDVDGGSGQAVSTGTGTTVAAHTHTHGPGTLDLANVTRRAFFRQ